MPDFKIAFAALGLVFLAFAPSAARADQRAVKCAVDWSGLRSSKDRSALDAFVGRCRGTSAGKAAASRIATLWPRVIVKVDKPNPPQPGNGRTGRPDRVRPAPPRALTMPEIYQRGVAAKYAGRMGDARTDFSAACYSGAIGQACHDLGLSYAIPPTGPFDYPNALRAYREGCRLGNRPACMGMVSYSGPKAQGGYVAADYRYGLDQLCRAFGSGEHCAMLGASYSTAAEGANYPLALDAFKRGCTAMTVIGCEGLRIFYSIKEYTNPINLPLAKEAFDRAYGAVAGSPTCSGEYAQSCLDLANYYWTNAREGSEAKRLALHRGACDGGKPVACSYAAGTIWLSNGAVGKFADVRPLYEKACAANIAAECLNLAEALRDARFGVVDLGRSAQMKDRACKLGQTNACPPANPYLAPAKK